MTVCSPSSRFPYLLSLIFSMFMLVSFRHHSVVASSSMLCLSPHLVCLWQLKLTLTLIIIYATLTTIKSLQPHSLHSTLRTSRTIAHYGTLMGKCLALWSHMPWSSLINWKRHWTYPRSTPLIRMLDLNISFGQRIFIFQFFFSLLFCFCLPLFLPHIFTSSCLPV